MKDRRLAGKDFFDVGRRILDHIPVKEDCPDRPQHAMCRATSRFVERLKPETLTLTVSGVGDRFRRGFMGLCAFNRKDYGMTKGIPFVKIADTVEVTVDLKGK